MKKAKHFGIAVAIFPAKDMPGGTTNSLSVDSTTGRITVNGRIWPKLPAPLRFWLLRWAYWRHSDGEIQNTLFADTMATRDYIKKGYKASVLMLWFIEMLRHKPLTNTADRITKMTKRLLKHGK